MDKQEYFKKLYFKQWAVGITRGDIRSIIRSKNFRQDNIKWVYPESTDRFFADPFILNSENGEINILYEDFSIDENYGNISLMTLNGRFEQVHSKVLLDTASHLSFPFIFKDNGRNYVIPESVKNGSISCYEYEPQKKALVFRGELLKVPLYDPTILKNEDTYWLFGSEFENRTEYKLQIYHSGKLMGPYTPHRGNPVRSGLDGIRSAGNFIEVDGDIYRPSQNCQNEYGESITINRIKVLDEYYFSEEPYMTINISKKNLRENNIHTIHTINFYGNLIVVDGIRWSFSLKEQWKNFRRNRKLLRNEESIKQ